MGVRFVNNWSVFRLKNKRKEKARIRNVKVKFQDTSMLEFDNYSIRFDTLILV